jgi:hypothetical protein
MFIGIPKKWGDWALKKDACLRGIPLQLLRL